jgi:cytochrome b subunit of formate dehydrogenase
LPVRAANRFAVGWRLLWIAFSVTITAAISAAENATPTSPAAAKSSASCLECHSDRDLSFKRDGKKVSLFVEEKAVAQSVHKSLECVDCHEKFDGDASPHRKPMVRVDCGSCHEDLGKKHAFHPRLALKEIPAGKDTDCAACHGSHAIVPVKSAASPFNDGAQLQSCGTCHAKTAEHFVASAHGRALAAHEQNAPDCLTCHKQPVVPHASAKPTLEQKLAQTKQCESCHVGKPNVAEQALRGTKFVTSFDQSVHGAALQKGEAGAANCVDCHGAHEMNRAMAANAKMNKQHVAETCAQCHEKQAREFGESVHAGSLQKGNVDSAACTDCHGEHDIRGHRDPTSPVHASNVAQQVCANCHASLKLTKKYGIASHTFQTFEDSYHGLAVRGGSVEVVNCASCHSSHAIKSQTDPSSTVNKANLVKTCGQCHPGANTRFAVGKVHVSPETANGCDGSSPILYIVSSVYVILIVVVVGGMFAHNLLDFIKKIRRKLAIQKGLIEEEHVAHRLYLRMTAHERVQHAVLVLSFVMLVITGFMLRYPEAWWVVAIRNVSVRVFEWRGWSHRIAGVVMLAGGAWHICYLVFTKPGRSLLRDLLPKWRDVTDPIGVLKYNLGLSATKPVFGRFSYIEKAEYWALVWGTLLMGATGAILWFENTSIGLFTKLGFDISRTVHFYEAILATLAIIVWHFYFVIFNPDVYPMNLAWLTGRMSEQEMLEEHPLQLMEMKAADAKATAPAVRPPHSEPPGSPKPPSKS